MEQKNINKKQQKLGFIKLEAYTHTHTHTHVNTYELSYRKKERKR